jgi:CubicO group peptidase (beta-lactamase class C family)
MGFRQTFLILALAGLSLAQQAPSSDAKSLATKADEFVSALAKQNKFSGVVLIARDGQPLFHKAYGMANLEWAIPNTTDTKFRLGSVTKQFTAAAIAKLEDAGKLKVSDKACNYLPVCPESWRNITIYQLVTHTSGIHNFTDVKEYNASKRATSRLQTQLALIGGMPLDFDPGTRMNYSNTGYLLLGEVIEKASGQKWEDYLRKEIFLPAGMTDTRVDSDTDVIPRRASGFIANNGNPRNADFIDMRIPGAAGALISTTGDLLKWDQALYNEKILPASTIARLFQPEKNNYAYGWMIETLNGKKTVGHGGGIDGFVTNISRFPEDKTLIVFLCNQMDSDIPTLRGLVDIAFGRPVEIPKDRKEIQLDPSLLDEYVGRYQIAPTFILTITRNGNQLITQATGQGPLPVFAEAKDALFAKAINAQLIFEREDGKIVRLILHQGGRKTPAKRLID